jgi:hypothetical protein
VQELAQQHDDRVQRADGGDDLGRVVLAAHAARIGAAGRAGAGIGRRSGG